MTDGDRRRWRTIAAVAATVLAGLLVFIALVAPNDVNGLAPAAFVRLPIEALVGIAFLLALPARARTVAAVLGGVGLGLLTVVKVLDMGFLSVLARPFDPVLDWVLLDDAYNFVAESSGTTAAIGAAVGAVLLVVAVLVLMTLATLRLTRLAVRRQDAASRALAAGTVVWLACAVLGAQIVPDVPVASRSAAGILYNRAQVVGVGLHDQQAFAAEAGVDAFHDTPPDQLLTALRGKDVVFTFVESYGRVALEDPALAPGVGAVLDDGNRRLQAAGFSSRSAFLTSPVAGGGSWLAHATFFSGLSIDNEQRHRNLVSGDRLTLSSAFRSANWSTVAVMPGTTRAWPEAGFFGYDRVHDAFDLGYHGPSFSWATMPDQYTFDAFQRLERSTPNRAPLMAEIPLVSSHAPWSPTPRLVGWDQLGDGSVFASMSGEGAPPSAIWTRDPTLVRSEYGQSIEYSLGSVISYLEKYGDDNLVFVFLGDHQPAPVVTGAAASRDVPITIVTRDQAVLDRIAGWDWQDGLRPSPQAPVWPMEAFRDRFLTAYGSQPTPTPAQH